MVLRLPLERAELVEAVAAARSDMVGDGRRPAEAVLELRAQLTTAVPWAPLVRLSSVCDTHDVLLLCLRHCALSMQGHVVAEEQLPLPQEWFEDAMDMEEQAAGPSVAPEDSLLELAQVSHGDVPFVAISGPEGLRCEVGCLLN